MMYKSFSFVFAIFLLLLSVAVHAQTIDPAMVQKALDQEGITEEELRAKLLEKGINLDEVKPEQLPQMEGAIRDAVAEIQAEKKKAAEVVEKKIEKAAEKKAEVKAEVKVRQKTKEISADAAQEVQKAVEKGKPLDEAISEEILDKKNEGLPGAGIFGHHIFRNKSIKVYNQATGVRAPETYELGPGDVVNVSIWGYSELSKAFEVSKDGYIKPAKMKPIFVKGIKLGDAKKLLRKAFGKYYNFRPDEFDVNLNYSRTITVNITGEAIHPGSYTLPALNTAFNALVASGGPSDIGSVREIMLIRPGQKPKRLDVYAFLDNPGIAGNAYLQEGDYIHIPVIKKVVSIGGAVVRPFKYELLPSENLNDLLRYAGGFTAQAYENKIQIKRFKDGEERLIDVKASDLDKVKLLNGDRVKVFSVPKYYENYVEIVGNVKLPGEYELEKGWKVSDLVHAGGLLPTSKLDFAFLRRINPNGTYRYIRLDLAKIMEDNASPLNIPLLPKDQIVVYSLEEFTDKVQVSIAGAVRSPKEILFDPSQDLRVVDLVQMAKGLTPKATDFAFLYRRAEENSKQINYVLVDLKAALKDPASPANIRLAANDRLFVPNNDTYLDEANVLISGAVHKSGEYPYDISLTLNKLLLLAGGVDLTADHDRVEIFRVDFESPGKVKTKLIPVQLNDQGLVAGEDVILFPFDEVRVRRKPDFELNQNVQINGEVKYPGVYALTKDNERLVDLIQKAGGLTDEAFPPGATLYRKKDGVGYIIIRLDDALKNKRSRYNMVLAEGDVIQIPKMKDFVSIEGSIKVNEAQLKKVIGPGNKINVPYHAGRRANFYVDEYAGGTSKYGRKRLITVRYPDGRLKKTKNFLLFNSYPKVTRGATIHVGAVAPKKQKPEEEKEPVDWGKLLSDTIAQATTIITLLLLVQRIN